MVKTADRPERTALGGQPRGERLPGLNRLVVGASATAVVADLALMVIVAELIPPLLVFAVLTVAAIVVTVRRPRSGIIALAVLAVVANIGGAPFLASDLSEPADPIAFVYAFLSGGGRLLAVVGAVLIWRRPATAPRPLVLASLGVVALVVFGSVLARLNVSSDERQDGDVTVLASDFAYPERVAVAAGGTLFLDNRDVIRHDFVVDGTDIKVLLEPRVQRRVTIDLPPGTYEFHCSIPGHESMTGTLEVGS